MDAPLHFTETKDSRLLKVLLILAMIFFVIVIVMTALFLWVVLKPVEKQKTKTSNHEITSSTSCSQRPPLFRLPSPLPNQIKKVLNGIDAHLIDAVQNSKGTANMSAMSIKIVYQNTTIFTGNYGSKVFKGSLAPNDHTRYRVGSVTKIFPVLLLYKLYEDGVITSLDEPLIKYAPNFSIKNPFGGTKYNITLRQIANQMSGLPRESPCGYYCNNTTTSEQLALLKDHHFVVKPWTIPSYSNLGYVLLGRILTENLLNKPFEKWVQDEILNPLGMKNTGFEINEDTKKNMALPYFRNGSLMTISDIGWANPAGGMYSTSEDLMKLARIFLQPDNQQLFKPDSIREMLLTDFITRDGLWLWGSPWEMRFVEGYLIRQKIGNIDSYNAVFSVIPELELGLCTLINVKAGVEGIGFALVDIFHKDLISAFNETLFEMQKWRHFPISAKPFTGKYILSRENLVTGVFENLTVIIDEHDVSLRVQPVEESPSFYSFFMNYIGNPLVFRATYSYVKNRKECTSSHFGAFAIMVFEQPGEDGLSRAFSSKEWQISARRI